MAPVDCSEAARHGRQGKVVARNGRMTAGLDRLQTVPATPILPGWEPRDGELQTLYITNTNTDLCQVTPSWLLADVPHMIIIIIKSSWDVCVHFDSFLFVLTSFLNQCPTETTLEDIADSIDITKESLENIAKILGDTFITFSNPSFCSLQTAISIQFIISKHQESKAGKIQVEKSIFWTSSPCQEVPRSQVFGLGLLSLIDFSINDSYHYH